MGALVERVEYDDYGLPTVHSQADRFASARPVSAYGNSYLYTGREWNATAGLYDYRHRQYDPFTGSFLTIDPIGQWGDVLNLGNGYAYVGGNPWRWVDPWGLCGRKDSNLDSSDNWVCQVCPKSTAGQRARADLAISNRQLPQNFWGNLIFGVISASNAFMTIGEPAGNLSVNYDRMSGAEIALALAEEAGNIGSVTGFGGGVGSIGKGIKGAAGAIDDAFPPGGLVDDLGRPIRPNVVDPPAFPPSADDVACQVRGSGSDSDDWDGILYRTHPGGDGKSIVGHGELPDDGKTMVVPEGTTITFHIAEGKRITTRAGRRIEDGKIEEAYGFIDADDLVPIEGGIGPRTALSGATIPDYVLKPPRGLDFYSNSIYIRPDQDKARLSELLGKDMGHMNWSACLEKPK